MIPEVLQKLVLKEEADSFTLSLGGAGLSSYAVPEGHFLYVWSVQIFPMLDHGQNNPTAAQAVERSAHYYEFDDLKNQKQGFLHRSSMMMTPDGTAAGNPMFAPPSGADIMPVFWIFKGQFLTLRIWHFPQLNPLVMDVPPRQESASSGAYPPAVPLLSLWQTGGAGFNWEPDARRDGTGQNRSPRPQSSAANEILTPALAGGGRGVTWPLVNLQVVQFPIDALQ